MTTDFPTASVGTSQAPTAAVEKSQSASHTEILTLPPNPESVDAEIVKRVSVARLRPELQPISSNDALKGGV
jgi:hypothetical protein